MENIIDSLKVAVKRYTYGKGNEHVSPLEVLERENKYLKQEIDLKKIQEIGKVVGKRNIYKIS